ncbi:ABC transporter permease [Puia sp. P3]|uniref:ABC transporter permease n=1 Tax=Puia sp. P3 TaxID=3423952 RepID=UPI003D669D11
MKNADPGFNKESVLLVPVPDKNKLDWLKQRLLADPGIHSVSFCYAAPQTGQRYLAGSISYDTRAWENFASRSIPADSDYLHTFQLRLVAGRNLRSGDSSHEVLINETLLHKFGFHEPGEVIGHRVVNGALGDLPGTIVGVVKDFNVQPLYGELLPVMITPFSGRYNYAAIKLGAGRQEDSRRVIQKTWQAAYPDKVFEYRYVNDEMDSFYHKDELLNKLIDVTALIAILISCLGLSGLISFFAARRTKEIGIRKVLGATVPGIVYLLSRDFLVMVAEALLVAVPLAWYFMNEWLHNFAYRIAIGWWIFALAGILSALIALCTVGYQSVRAALVNPVKSLRSE